ncbi:MAG: glutathione S-transferase N-terminal domain-containing protein [Gammaproteobacteria bacterium]|nr:glutathione S-transferase N-terminal domain-containing protein [Gammaproteobacteria bacterium]
MKLYDSKPAPNPRRVRIFLAEKGILLDGGDIERIEVDIARGEQRNEAALARNPLGQIPVLELDDGTCISESVAICRYFEGVHPQPSLFGADPVAEALVEMWNRRVEFGLLGPVGVAWRNGPIVARMAPGRFRQNEQAKEEAEEAARRFYRRLDGWLAERTFLAGEAYSVADITALCTVDFATALVALAPDPALSHLGRWHADVSARPSAQA